MAKKLIHKKNIHEIYRNGEDKIFISKEMILTPSAKDFIREKGITVIHKDTSIGKKESLEEQIKRILKYDFHVEEEKLVQIILNKVMRR